MKDAHVYARDAVKPALADRRKEAKNALTGFLFGDGEPVSGRTVSSYCHAYALEAAYQGDRGYFIDQSEYVDGTNEWRFPRYSLYYAIYSQTMRTLIEEVLKGDST
jgi:hypothetical protein